MRTRNRSPPSKTKLLFSSSTVALNESAEGVPLTGVGMLTLGERGFIAEAATMAGAGPPVAASWPWQRE